MPVLQVLQIRGHTYVSDDCLHLISLTCPAINAVDVSLAPDNLDGELWHLSDPLSGMQASAILMPFLLVAACLLRLCSAAQTGRQAIYASPCIVCSSTAFLALLLACHCGLQVWQRPWLRGTALPVSSSAPPTT
jgi:hypothetical protein